MTEYHLCSATTGVPTADTSPVCKHTHRDPDTIHVPGMPPMSRHNPCQLPSVFRYNLCANAAHALASPMCRHHLPAITTHSQVSPMSPDMPPMCSHHPYLPGMAQISTAGAWPQDRVARGPGQTQDAHHLRRDPTQLFPVEQCLYFLTSPCI